MRTVFIILLFLISISFSIAAPDWESPFGIVCPWSGLKEAGIKWVRCGAGATSLGDWCSIEKTKGSYTWEQSDQELVSDIQQGLTPLPILGYTPSWASSGPKNESSAPPKNLLDYAAFVDRCVSHYAGRIPCWEVWNEPDIGFFTGSICDYTDMLKTACTAAKNVDPYSKVVFGGTAGVNLNFIRRVYEFGGKDYFDVMAVHPYQWGETFNDGWFISQLADLRRLMNEKGDIGKEIWLTEMGWSTGDKGITEEVQAKLLAQAMITALTLKDMGVTRTFWFSVKDWGGSGHGIIRDNGSRKPSYDAYSTLTKVMTEARYVGRHPLGDGVRCHVFRRNNAVIVALWADSKIRVKIPASSAVSQVECLDYLGKPVKLRADSGEYLIWAQPEPIYIVRADESLLKKLEKPVLPPFVRQDAPAPIPPPVWASIVTPPETTRPFISYGSKSTVAVRVQNQSNQPVKGKIYLNIEGIQTPAPQDYSLKENSSKNVMFTLNVPASGRRGLVECTIGGTTNGVKLIPNKTTVRICGGRVIEFLANSNTENRYLFKNEGSGGSPSVRFNGTWTYKFDLTKAKYARVEMNIGANQAG